MVEIAQNERGGMVLPAARLADIGSEHFVIIHRLQQWKAVRMS